MDAAPAVPEKVPVHSTKRGQIGNLATLVNNQFLQDYNCPGPEISIGQPTRCAAKPRVRMPIDQLEGDYKGAVRLACSEDVIAEHNDHTLEALRAKHPRPHPNRRYAKLRPPPTIIEVTGVNGERQGDLVWRTS